MPKVTGPLLSVSASGKFAETLVFFYWKGISAVRKWITPTNPRTEKQLIQRERFATGVNTYHKLNFTDQAALQFRYTNAAYTGFNKYVSWVVNQLKKGKIWVCISWVFAISITHETATIEATPDQDGILKVYVGTKPGKWRWNFEEPAPGGPGGTPHFILVFGLKPETVYWYNVKYVQTETMKGDTGWYTFTTIAAPPE